LSGKNAAGGAVFINTNDPHLDELDGSVELGGGDYGSLEATGIVNIRWARLPAAGLGIVMPSAITSTNAITGDYTGHPGEVDNNSYRVGLLWQPSDSFSATLKVDYHDLDFGGNPTTVFGQEPLGVVEQYANFVYTDESTRAVLDLAYKFGNGITLTSLTGYQDIKSVNNLDLNATINPPIYIFNSRIDADFYSKSSICCRRKTRPSPGRSVSSGRSRIRCCRTWEKGGFNFIAAPSPTSPTRGSPLPGTTRKRIAPFFAHGRYRITDEVELEAGVRYGRITNGTSL
jgi:iron complex outermembrane receptor protein